MLDYRDDRRFPRKHCVLARRDEIDFQTVVRAMSKFSHTGVPDDFALCALGTRDGKRWDDGSACSRRRAQPANDVCDTFYDIHRLPGSALFEEMQRDAASGSRMAPPRLKRSYVRRDSKS